MDSSCHRAELPNENGFTLIETLLALLILVLFALPLAAIQVEIQDSASRDEHRTRASALAMEKLEELLDIDYADLAAGSDRVVVREGLELDRSWSITDDSPVADMKTIDVAVQAGDGDPVVFTTAVGRPHVEP